MNQKEPTFYEQVSTAVDAGDRQKLTEIYRRQSASYAGNQSAYSSQVLETTLNAARKDPNKFQRELLIENLSVMAMLAHRVQEELMVSIKQHDNVMCRSTWGGLPDQVADILLPRYGKISSEIRTTVKLLQQLDAPPAPATGPTNAGQS